MWPSAAKGLMETVGAVRGSLSGTQDVASDLESALREASDTPVIGGAIGGLASTAGRLESELAGLASNLADFEGDLGSVAAAFESALGNVTESHEQLLKRWIEEPHDPQWPPSDPERRPNEVAEVERTAPTSGAEPAAVPGESPSGRSRMLDRDGGVESEPGDLSFVSVNAARYEFACGVTTSGDALCWGDDDYGQATPPAGVSFASVSAGGMTTPVG